MRKSLVALSTVAALGLFACQPNNDAQSEQKSTTQAAGTPASEMTDTQKHAYAMGASLGMFVENRAEMQEQINMPLDKAALMEGFQDSMGGNLKFSEEEIQQIAQEAEQTMRAAQQQAQAKAAEDNIKKGEEFLAENAKKDGVTVTDSGLQYEVLTEGTGKSPVAEDTVKVNYEGTLIDGTVFDSSYKRGEPVSFPLNQVIPGWTEGVQLMKEGAKYRFYIPSELAYGQRATGLITPNSTLIFDVELLEVVDTSSEESE